MSLFGNEQVYGVRPEGGGAGREIRVRGLRREFKRGGGRVHALQGVDVTFAPGSFTAVMGPSGSGKTTLLQCVAGMDRPTRGAVHWGPTEITRLREHKLARLRRSTVGFVFQAYNLMPAMTVAENVVLPTRLMGGRVDRARVGRVLTQVGLGGCEKERPGRLSGGQQQRVAIARALYNQPEILFADEPTGALDRNTGREILRLLREGVEEHGRTCVMVTHDPLAASFADRVLMMTDGELVEDLTRPSAAVIAEKLGGLS
ncbi:ABC transporter ATP-binding protein [Planomonospora parontospora subsp. parontospora]|uniref:ABC transporter ATP-binding protein n=2 Tax=Planomonospora parontospora TaxID=58119 RepID=A0AA37BKU6_9ACTN|nr:ABC transporter ATP-binding protein [Planomonospora parontospora]GGK86255.1 ABC transporter ATP-binding protein [Planomonospora parontospora]GII10866.1 ABC transporter ATP-binding protein [Planomonospora parontospora subsp. parontospora]